MKKGRFFLLAIFLISIQLTSGQDAHYWASSYGPAGFFTPGAVIARNKDSGVLFYNPALLAYNNRNAASITGTIYQWQNIKIPNGAGTGYPLNSAVGAIVPLIASNSISFNKKKPFTLVYAIVHSTVLNFSTSQRIDTKLNALDDSYSPGEEIFISQFSHSNDVNETSGLLNAGFKVSKKMAIGFSLEGSLRSQDYLVDYKTRALVNTGTDTILPPIVSVQEYYHNDNYQVGLRLKAGLSYDLSGRTHLGLVITSPMLKVTAAGNILSDLEVSNLLLDPSVLNLLANTQQEKLSSQWKTPFSIAVGISQDFQRGQFYIVAEYFGKLKEYNVVTPLQSAFIRPDTTTDRETPSLLKLKDVRKAIANVGMGFSYELDKSITGYISLRTDFCYADEDLFTDDRGFKVNTTQWNNYHLQTGVNMRKKRFNLRSGLILTHGRTSNFQQPINFEDPNEANLLQGTVGNTEAKHLTVGLLVSYILNL